MSTQTSLMPLPAHVLVLCEPDAELIRLCDDVIAAGGRVSSAGRARIILRESGIDARGVVEDLDPSELDAALGSDRVLDRIGASGPEGIDCVVAQMGRYAPLVERPDRPDQAPVDLGLATLIRYAAMHWRDVITLTSPDDWSRLRDAGRAGTPADDVWRRTLGARAWTHAAAYDAAVSRWLLGHVPADHLPDQLVVAYERQAVVRAENAHQRAAVYADPYARWSVLSQLDMNGPEPAAEQVVDLGRARMALTDFEVPACLLMRGGQVSMGAVGDSAEAAYFRLLETHPGCAEGALVATNRTVGQELLDRLVEDGAAGLLCHGDVVPQAKIPVWASFERRKFNPGEMELRHVPGGVLVQDLDQETEGRDEMHVAGRAPDETGWGDLLLAWRIAKHARSEAAVLVSDLRTVSVVAGASSHASAIAGAIVASRIEPAGCTLAIDGEIRDLSMLAPALDAGVSRIIHGGDPTGPIARALIDRGVTLVSAGRAHRRRA